MTVFNISLPCALPRPNRRSAFETPGSDAKGHSSEQPNLRAVATRSCNLSQDIRGPHLAEHAPRHVLPTIVGFAPVCKQLPGFLAPSATILLNLPIILYYEIRSSCAIPFDDIQYVDSYACVVCPRQ